MFIGIIRLISVHCTPATFQIGHARYRAPECLFRPDLIGEECEGLHEVLIFAIQKSDMDLRKILFQNIVLSGGSTLYKVSCCPQIAVTRPQRFLSTKMRFALNSMRKNVLGGSKILYNQICLMVENVFLAQKQHKNTFRATEMSSRLI